MAQIHSARELTKWQAFVESKPFCWLLENATVFAITYVRSMVPEPKVSGNRFAVVCTMDEQMG